MADILTSPDLVIVFAQAMAGLGHLRVTHALFHGLPKGAHAVLLGTKDTNITAIHNLTSQNMLMRREVQFFETGAPQDLFTFLYTQWLCSHTKDLRLQLQTILDRHPLVPKTILVVATHFGLAHQLAHIKQAFAAENKIRMMVVVVVTDDAPFHIWAVPGADMTVVPSDHTKWALTRYLPGEYIVLPYMVSPRLAVPLSTQRYGDRAKQLDSESTTKIHVSLPISGAAVQLHYITKLVRALSRASDRFTFHVVSKQTKMTEKFLQVIAAEKNVELITSTHDREVVELYETLYEKEVIAIEVTKPSEQAFKALISPKKIGGSILLFSDPVGLQEKLNLAFLERHGLLGPKGRGMKLPVSAEESAAFMLSALQSGVFASMGKFVSYEKNPGIADDGVRRFWHLMRERLSAS